MEILTSIFLFLFILSLVFFGIVYFLRKKNSDNNKWYNKKLLYLLTMSLPVIILLTGIAIYFLKGRNSEVSLAKSILKEKDNDAYKRKCDKLFRMDPALDEQYEKMKASRPEYETLNLCKNHAKVLTGSTV